MGGLGSYKLLALDIDGTILNTQGDIASGVVEVLNRVVGAGVLVTICTGRGTTSSREVALRLPLNAPLILQGGALILERYEGRVLDFCNLPNAVALEAIRVLQSHSLAPIVYESMPAGWRFFYDSHTTAPEALSLYTQSQPERAVEVNDLLSDIKEDPSVVGAVGLESCVMEVVEAVTACLPEANVVPEYSTWYPGNAWIYAFPKEASKGIALKKVVEHLRITREEVMAVGDNLNDLDMLEYAGLGVAMENSPEEVKQVADVVTGSNDDHGLVHAIERFILTTDH